MSAFSLIFIAVLAVALLLFLVIVVRIQAFVALTIAALLSFDFLGIRQSFSQRQVLNLVTKSLEPVGLIILVTGAGGVLGRVLITTGIGETLANLMAATSLPVIVLAFFVAVLVRVSQDSATVAMLTTAGCWLRLSRGLTIQPRWWRQLGLRSHLAPWSFPMSTTRAFGWWAASLI